MLAKSLKLKRSKKTLVVKINVEGVQLEVLVVRNREEARLVVDVLGRAHLPKQLIGQI